MGIVGNFRVIQPTKEDVAISFSTRSGLILSILTIANYQTNGTFSLYFREISEGQLGILMLHATSTKFLECFLAERSISYLYIDGSGTCPLTLVPLENIASINLLLHIIQSLVVAIGNNGIALLLELIEIIYDT